MAVTQRVQDLSAERDRCELRVREIDREIAQLRSGDVVQFEPDKAASREDVAADAALGSLASREPVRDETPRETAAREELDSRTSKSSKSKK